MITPEEFKKAAQRIYNKYDGWAGDDGHIERDCLMRDVLRELGYGDGVDILFEMDGVWYS